MSLFSVNTFLKVISNVLQINSVIQMENVSYYTLRYFKNYTIFISYFLNHIYLLKALFSSISS